MSRYTHRSVRRNAEVESEFAHARYIVVPALVWAAAVVAMVVTAVLEDVPSISPDQVAAPEAVPIIPFGA